jgi:hypothetical protein
MAFLVPFSRNAEFVGRGTALQDIETSKYVVTILDGPSGIG